MSPAFCRPETAQARRDHPPGLLFLIALVPRHSFFGVVFLGASSDFVDSSDRLY